MYNGFLSLDEGVKNQKNLRLKWIARGISDAELKIREILDLEG